MSERRKLSQSSIDFIDLALRDVSDGSWVFVLAKNAERDTAHHFRIRRQDLVSRLADIQTYEMSNYYISANAFMGGKKRTESKLYSLHNIVIDIDCHGKVRTPGLLDLRLDNLVHTILHDGVDEYGLLMPNAIVYTGRGLQIWWFHEGLSAQSNRWTWNSVGEHLLEIMQQILLNNKSRDPVESFAGLSVDLSASFSPAGVYRIPGTMNLAAGCKATAQIISERRYSLSELKEFNKEHKKKINHYALRIKGDCAKWALKMLSAIESLRFYRNKEPGAETRNNFCFAYYCMLRTAGFDLEETEAKLAAFNAKFITPMTARELDSSLCSARRKNYKLSTKAIMDILDVSPEEEDRLFLHYGIKKNDRNSVKEDRAEKYEKIISLYKKGRYTLKEIAAQAGVSIPTARRILRLNGYTVKGSRNEKILALKDTGMTAEEVAAKVGCSLSTVWRVLREARKQKAAADSAAAAPASRPVSFYAVSCQKKNDSRNNGYLYPAPFRSAPSSGEPGCSTEKISIHPKAPIEPGRRTCAALAPPFGPKAVEENNKQLNLFSSHFVFPKNVISESSA